MSIPVISYLLKWRHSTYSSNFRTSPPLSDIYLKIKRINFYFLESKATLKIISMASKISKSEPSAWLQTHFIWNGSTKRCQAERFQWKDLEIVIFSLEIHAWLGRNYNSQCQTWVNCLSVSLWSNTLDFWAFHSILTTHLRIKGAGRLLLIHPNNWGLIK